MWTFFSPLIDRPCDSLSVFVLTFLCFFVYHSHKNEKKMYDHSFYHTKRKIKFATIFEECYLFKKDFVKKKIWVLAKVFS